MVNEKIREKHHLKRCHLRIFHFLQKNVKTFYKLTKKIDKKPLYIKSADNYKQKKILEADAAKDKQRTNTKMDSCLCKRNKRSQKTIEKYPQSAGRK